MSHVCGQFSVSDKLHQIHEVGWVKGQVDSISQSSWCQGTPALPATTGCTTRVRSCMFLISGFYLKFKFEGKIWVPGNMTSDPESLFSVPYTNSTSDPQVLSVNFSQRLQVEGMNSRF